MATRTWSVASALLVLVAAAVPIRATTASAAPAPLQVDTHEIVGILAEEHSETVLVASGGTPPYRWAQRTTGPGWNGMTLTAEGVLRGSPIHLATNVLPVRVVDAAGHQADAEVRLETAYPPMIATWTLPDGFRGTSYVVGLEATFGVGPLRWTTSGTLPPGLSVREPWNGEATSSSGLLAGTPTATGTWAFTVHLVDRMGRSAQRDLTLTVGEATVPSASEHGPDHGGFNLVRWSGPESDGGAPITGFVLTPYRGSTRLAPILVPERPRILDLLDDLPRGAYTFTVAAVNRVGAGPASPRSEEIAVFERPAAPRGLVASRGDRQVVLRWTAPDDGGEPLVRYRVEGLDAQGTVLISKVVPSSATRTTITDVVPGWAYRFRVIAQAEHLEGRPSALTAPVVGATLPGPAPSPRALPGDGTATLTATAAAPNGAAVTAYLVTPVVGGVARPTQAFPGTSTTWRVTGLANGVVHTFRVAAVNAIGAGPVTTTATIRIGVPRPPVGVVARAGRRQATVTWTDGATNGAKIVRYVVTPHLDGIAQAPQAFDARTRSRVISGLAPGRRYTFTVRATNGRGTSEASAPSAAVRPS